MDTDIDELEPRNGSILPPVLHEDATPEEMVKAVNGLAVELQLIRMAFQAQGTAFALHCKRVELALGIAKTRDTDPAPPGDGT